MNEKNVATLTEELDLSAQERTEVEAIQTKEELAAYFEKIPRDYDVQIIVADHTPECMSALRIKAFAHRATRISLLSNGPCFV